jgi:ATP-dependent Lon protease
VIWIMTANDERLIPEPIMNRMNVFEIETPNFEMARTIARNLYVSIRREHGWGARFDTEPRDDVLDRLAELAPRDMRRALMMGFGNARLDAREEILADDLPRPASGKGKVGFIQ